MTKPERAVEIKPGGGADGGEYFHLSGAPKIAVSLQDISTNLYGEWHPENRGSPKILARSRNLGNVSTKSQRPVTIRHPYMCHDRRTFKFVPILDQYCTISPILDQYELLLNVSFKCLII